MWKSLIRVFCILIGFVCLKIVIKSQLCIFEEDVKLIVIRVVQRDYFLKEIVVIRDKLLFLRFSIILEFFFYLDDDGFFCVGGCIWELKLFMLQINFVIILKYYIFVLIVCYFYEKISY